MNKTNCEKYFANKQRKERKKEQIGTKSVAVEKKNIKDSV